MQKKWMEYIFFSIIITPLRENLFIIIMKYVTTQDEIKQKKQYGMILNTDSNNNNGFQHFAMSNQFPTYIKDAIHIIEHVNQIKEYHLRIVNIEHIKLYPGVQNEIGKDGLLIYMNQILDCFSNSTFFTETTRNNLLNSLMSELFQTTDNVTNLIQIINIIKSGFIIFFVGEKGNTSGKIIPRALALENLDSKIEYTDAGGVTVSLPLSQRDIMVKEGKYCRVFLDAKGRNKLISTCNRFVRRQTDLSDDELHELWRLPISLLLSNDDTVIKYTYLDCRINAGIYQNIAHLHLKVAVENNCMSQWQHLITQLKNSRKERKGVTSTNSKSNERNDANNNKKTGSSNSNNGSGYKVLALISGGKDSTYNMQKCVQYGHEIVALANLYPKPIKDQLDADSFCFQSVGHNVIPLIGECMGLPLIRRETSMKAKVKTMLYDKTEGDEVEDLFELIKLAKEKHPEINAVASGAIFSDYQRIRVENVCTRLGLISLSYLWRRDQTELLEEMRLANINAIIIKIASLGLTSKRHLGKNVTTLTTNLGGMKDKFGLNVCGEGGEYETLTLDCNLYKKRIIIDEAHVETIQDDGITEVALYIVDNCHCEIKDDETNGMNNNEVVTKDTIKLVASPPPHKVIGKHIHLSSICVENCKTLASETTAVMQEMKNRLKNLGASVKDVLFVHLFVDDMSNFTPVNNVYKTFFGTNPPSRACVQAYLPQNCKVMVDCFAHIGSGDAINDNRISLPRQVLHVQSISEWAPTCIGPYSQSNIFSGLIYQAGQIALVPGTMKLIQGGLIMELKQAFDNVAAVYDALKSKLVHTYSCIVYISKRYDFIECRQFIVNESNRRLPPSCKMIDIVGIPELPRSAAVEIEVCGVTNEFRKIIKNWDTIEKNGNIQCNAIYIPTGFLSCSIKSELEHFNEDDILKMILNVLDKSKLTANELFHIRIFYPANNVHFDLNRVKDFVVNSIPGNSSISYIGCNDGNEVIFRIEGRDFKAFHAQVWLKDWPYED